jgi:alpha-amylase
MRAWYKRLIELRRQNLALSKGGYRKLSSDGDLLVFERSDAESGNAVVVAVNRGKADAAAVVDVPQAWAGATTVAESLSGASVPLDAGRLGVAVPARQARIYVSHSNPAPN